MSKPKKRTKRYHPREKRAPHELLTRLLPEMTEAEYDRIDIVSFTHLDALRRREGSETDIFMVLSALRTAHFCAKHFSHETEWESHGLFCVAEAGIILARDALISKGPEAVERWMLEPAHHALEHASALMRAMSRSELSQALRACTVWTRTVTDLRYEVAVAEPGERESWKSCYDRAGVAYIHGGAECGCFEERDGVIFWRDTATTPPRLIRITSPTIVVLSARLAPDFREGLKQMDMEAGLCPQLSSEGRTPSQSTPTA